jgi:hypothetical protein
MKDFAQGHSRVEKLRDKLHRSEMQLVVPLFERHSAGMSRHQGNSSPEDWASLFLSMLRGTDRLLTKTDGPQCGHPSLVNVRVDDQLSERYFFIISLNSS